MIDDLEDGDGAICNAPTSAGRQGSWYTLGDGTNGALLEPAPGEPFVPTLIPDGRGASRYAAHMTGSGFTGIGARMGFNLSTQNLAVQPYNVGTTGGLRFWMKSNEPVIVTFPTTATIPSSQSAGACADSATAWNCDNPLGFGIASPSASDWIEYDVPFASLVQGGKNDADGNSVTGSVAWNPASVVAVEFWVPPVPLSSSLSFDVWVDDVRFYDCSGGPCAPTCTAPLVACAASGTTPARCWPAGTECSTVPVADKWLTAAWGSGPNDVWALGFSSTRLSRAAFHWTGAAWSAVSIGGTSLLAKIWGSSPNDMWAVGDFGAIVHSDGRTWSTVPSNTTESLASVWGSQPNDVWAVGYNGTILHWDGSAWLPVPSGTTFWLTSLWGSGPSDVWAVGYSVNFEGIILHWDGSTWATVWSEPDRPLFGIQGTGAGDIWAVGGGGAPNFGAGIFHWDGAAWSQVQPPSGPAGFPSLLHAVWASGPNDVWAMRQDGGALHWDGTVWSQVPSGTTQGLFDVWGSGPDNVWAVGAFGTILHWTGAAWSVVPRTAIR